MNSSELDFEAVKNLIKNSKQLQSKIQNELTLKSKASPDMPVLNEQQNFMSRIQIQRIVAERIQNNPNSSSKLNAIPVKDDKIRTTMSKNKNIPKQKHSSHPVAPAQVLHSLNNSHRKACSVTTPVSGKRNMPTKLPSRNESLKGSKISLESKKLTSTSSYRLPLQRFADSANKTTHFSEEHPELELDMSPEQTTLFPRRYQKATISKESLLEDEDSINLVAAEVKPTPQTPMHATLTEETWNGILNQNQTKSKQTQTIPREKKTKKVSQNTSNDQPVVPEEESHATGVNVDIITSVPTKGLFALEQQNNQLAKQKKCNFQRFPVLYIKPECRIQKLTAISIQDDFEKPLKDRTHDRPPGNVKYCVYKHQDENSLETTQFTNNLQINITTQDECNISGTENTNKFFKPFDFAHLPQAPPSSSTQSSLSSPSMSFTESSCSVENDKKHNSSSKSDRSVKSSSRNTRPSQLPTSKLSASSPSRREVYVQTDCKHKETVSTNTSPLPTSINSIPLTPKVPKNIDLENNKITQTAETNSEDDIIAKIFERILSDLPNVLETFKSRIITTSGNESLAVSPQTKLEQRNQTKAVQTSDEETKSSFKKVEPQLNRIPAKALEEGYIPTNSCVEQSLPKTLEHTLWQNQPFLHKNVTNESNPDMEKYKQEDRKHPTDVEVKRAMKIFIDSLKTNTSCNIESSDNNTSRNYNSARRKCDRQSCLKWMKCESARLENCTSSAESSDDISRSAKNMINKKVHNIVRQRRSSSTASTSSGLYSIDLESESDATNKDSLNENEDESDMSFGEVKSIGEV